MSLPSLGFPFDHKKSVEGPCICSTEEKAGRKNGRSSSPFPFYVMSPVLLCLVQFYSLRVESRKVKWGLEVGRYESWVRQPVWSKTSLKDLEIVRGRITLY